MKDLASGDCGVVRRGVCAFFRVLLSRESVEEGEGVAGDSVACAMAAKWGDQKEGWTSVGGCWGSELSRLVRRDKVRGGDGELEKRDEEEFVWLWLVNVKE